VAVAGRLEGNGRLTIGAGGAFTISNDVSCTFSGLLSGTGALNKRGPATFQVTANSYSYTGLATVITYQVPSARLLNENRPSSSQVARLTNAE